MRFRPDGNMSSGIHDKRQQQRQREKSRREQIWVLRLPVLFWSGNMSRAWGTGLVVIGGGSSEWMINLLLRWIHLSIEIIFVIELFEAYYLRSGWRNREWQKIYRLRFVLDGVRSLCRLVVLNCIFTFKSKQSS